MFYKVFLSPQMKRCAIIPYKHGIYELPHELPNYLSLLKTFEDITGKHLYWSLFTIKLLF